MKKQVFILLLALFVISLCVNFFLLFSGFNNSNNIVTNQNSKSKFPFLSQKILLDYNKDLLINFVDLRANLRELVSQEYGSDFTFYFEYLPTGASIGVNEKTEFYSASLLKLPLIMAYFHDKEQNSLDSSDPEITIQKEDLDSDYGELWKRGVGAKLKSSELVKLTLEDSDNTAAHALDRFVEDDDVSYIFNGLDITVNFDVNSTASITTKAYSSILKSLFFSSLLSHENSQYILEALSKTRFLDKLPAGVPKNVVVSHKIGVYEKGVSVPIYSDCGIVYVPNREYILCMASRSNEQTARLRMKTVSKIVYDYVVSAKSSK